MNDAYFARILPVVGGELLQKRVALFGCAAGALLAELLAASGVVRWLLAEDGPAAAASPLVGRFGRRWAGQQAHSALAAALHSQYGATNAWQCAVFSPNNSNLDIDLVLSAGDHPQADRLAMDAACPLVQLQAGAEAGPDSWPAGFYVEQTGEQHFTTSDPFAAAAFARALLLRNTPYARPDLEGLVQLPGNSSLVETTDDRRPTTDGSAAGGRRSSVVGRLVLVRASSAPEPPLYRMPRSAPALKERTTLIIGCGSLGSYLAAELAPVVGKLVLVDADHVSAYNPIRQLYTAAQIGQAKALALAANLAERWGEQAATLLPVRQQISEEVQIEALLAAHQPDLVLLATGTNADFALARALYRARVAHLVMRCYSRARFWEAIVVPDQHAPCLGCLRGHLYVGPQPPPTPEEAAAYVAPGELVGEPATLVESGWAAHCMAELAVQCLAPPGLREQWFSTALADGATCFIGGAYAFMVNDTWAYGIERPGQVRAYGVSEIAGSATERICGDCGRTWLVQFRID